MQPSHNVIITRKDGTEVYGQVMYLIVWEGKALSGGEVLVRGDDIDSMELSEVDE